MLYLWFLVSRIPWDHWKQRFGINFCLSFVRSTQAQSQSMLDEKRPDHCLDAPQFPLYLGTLTLLLPSFSVALSRAYDRRSVKRKNQTAIRIQSAKGTDISETLKKLLDQSHWPSKKPSIFHSDFLWKIWRNPHRLPSPKEAREQSDWDLAPSHSQMFPKIVGFGTPKSSMD